MREIRLSGSEGGVTFKPPSLPLSSTDGGKGESRDWESKRQKGAFGARATQVRKARRGTRTFILLLEEESA
jgi:hypothetical protein